MYVDLKQKNEAGGLYNINSVFGKGLVKAHEKAEKQHWAGTVIDESFIDELVNRGYDVDTFLKPYSKKFKVPYKNGLEFPDEFVMPIIKGQLNDESFKNYGNGIYSDFIKLTQDKNYEKEFSTYYDWIANRGVGFYFQKLQVELGGTPHLYIRYTIKWQERLHITYKA